MKGLMSPCEAICEATKTILSAITFYLIRFIIQYGVI